MAARRVGVVGEGQGLEDPGPEPFASHSLTGLRPSNCCVFAKSVRGELSPSPLGPSGMGPVSLYRGRLSTEVASVPVGLAANLMVGWRPGGDNGPESRATHNALDDPNMLEVVLTNNVAQERSRGCVPRGAR